MNTPRTTTTCARLLVASVTEHQQRLNQAAGDSSPSTPAHLYLKNLRQSLRLLAEELIELEDLERKAMIALLAEKFPNTAQSLQTM